MRVAALAMAALSLSATLLLAGCASAPTVAPLSASATAKLFRDSRFAPPASPVSADPVFRVTPAMQRYLQEEVMRGQHGKDLRQALFDALYRKDKLQLEYDSAMTRTAEQAFTARRGNCLSLVIMTA
ncbi:MAG: hypothetical protein ACEQSK_07505, partial [Sphingomonadaceae bacterium]